MSDSADSHVPLVPQPATALASVRVDPGKLAQYIEAQNAITAAARDFPGYVGTQVLEPVPGLQEEWVVIFRFESNATIKNWLESAERSRLVAQIDENLLAPSRMLLLASNDNAEPPASMVYAHRVSPAKVPAYLQWRRKAIAAQSRYPGYQATEFFRPWNRVRRVAPGSIRSIAARGISSRRGHTSFSKTPSPKGIHEMSLNRKFSEQGPPMLAASLAPVTIANNVAPFRLVTLWTHPVGRQLMPPATTVPDSSVTSPSIT